MEFISEGSEKYESGVTDNKGRDCGSTVIYGTDGENLTAYVHANRDGVDFCRNGGAFKKFPLTATNEAAASAARSAWVAQAVQAAKDRAAKKWR